LSDNTVDKNKENDCRKSRSISLVTQHKTHKNACAGKRLNGLVNLRSCTIWTEQ